MQNNDCKFLVQQIRAQYREKEYTALDELKALDQMVKRPVNGVAYGFGTVCTLVMGCGMSLVMTDISRMFNIAEPMVLGIAIGVIGMFGMAINYPIYRKMLDARRRKYAGQIFALSDKIIQQET